MFVVVVNLIVVNKNKKNVNFDCSEAIIPFTNTKDSLQELDFDCSVCMAAIY